MKLKESEEIIYYKLYSLKDVGKKIGIEENEIRSFLEKKKTIGRKLGDFWLIKGKDVPEVKRLLIKRRQGRNRTKSGYREDLKQYFESRWEANIARYYKHIGEIYVYKYKEFKFEATKYGQRSFKPDFYLPTLNSWVELNGFLKTLDKVELRQFKKCYPKEFAKTQFIIRDPHSKSKINEKVLKFLVEELGIRFTKIRSYKKIEEKLSKLIPNWE